MTEPGVEFVLVPGVRFRATLVYSEPRELDQLARFFYDEVLPRETDLGRLRKLFGLPPRVMDEVLADLVRLHYATLDIPAGRVIRNPRPSAHPSFYTAPEEGLWQDKLTGAVIRYRDIPQAFRGVDGDAEDVETFRFQATELKDSDDFRNLPSGRLVTMLKSTSPAMAVRVDGAQLESLVGRTLFCEEAIRVPVSPPATIDGDRFFFVDAPDLPALYTRSWSRVLNRQLGGREVSAGTKLMVAAYKKSESPTIVDRSSVSLALSRYHQAVSDLCATRDPTEVDTLRDAYTRQRDSLSERIESIAAVSLARPSDSKPSHFADLWGRARSYLMLVVEDATPSSVSALVETLGSPLRWQASLILVEAAEGEGTVLRSLPRDVSPDLLQCPRLGELPTVGLCVRDGVEIRIGSLSALMDAEPVPGITGGAVPHDLAMRVFSRFPSTGARGFIESLLSSTDSREARRKACFGDARDLAAACDALAGRVQRTDGLVLRALDRAKSEWQRHADARLRADMDGDASESLPEPPGILDLVPELRTLKSELTDAAHGDLMPAPLAPCYQPEFASPIEILGDTVRFGRRSESRSLVVSFDSDGSALDDAALRNVLKEVLDAECEVHLYLNPKGRRADRWDRESDEALDRLEQAMAHHRLFLRRGRRSIPVAIIVDRRFVILGQHSWFTEGTGRETLVALESPNVANLLHAIATE